jgi:hypothetical protein
VLTGAKRYTWFDANDQAILIDIFEGRDRIAERWERRSGHNANSRSGLHFWSRRLARMNDTYNGKRHGRLSIDEANGKAVHCRVVEARKIYWSNDILRSNTAK